MFGNVETLVETALHSPSEILVIILILINEEEEKSCDDCCCGQPAQNVTRNGTCSPQVRCTNGSTAYDGDVIIFCVCMTLSLMVHLLNHICVRESEGRLTCSCAPLGAVQQDRMIR